MLRVVLAVLGLMGANVAAVAQESVEGTMLEQGQTLYESRCAICHKVDGSGTGSTFPALRDNPNLEDAGYIVTLVHYGGALMPPFPALSDAEIAAIASYVRSSFGNAHGGVSEDDVASIRADFEPTGEVRSIWDGVYTEEQAQLGATVFPGPCGLCHGRRHNGAPADQDMLPAPPLARERFLRVWDGRSLGALLSYTRATMPQSNPGFLSDEEYVGIIAHMLATSGAPAGDMELPADVNALGHIIIEPEP